MNTDVIFVEKMFKRTSSQTTPASQAMADDLFACLRPILKFGQAIGICPYRGLWSADREDFPTFRWNSLPGFLHISITCLLGVNVVMNCAGMITKVMTGQTNPIQIAWAVNPFMMYAIGFYTYIHFTKNVNKLFDLFRNWSDSCNEIEYMEENKSVFWKIQITTVVVMASAMLENIVYHLRNDCFQSNCQDLDGYNFTGLELYYRQEHQKNWAGVPYNPVITGLLFVANKLTVLSTNFADVFIYTMAWVVSSKLQGFVNIVSTKIKDKSICWVQTRKDYILLFTLLQDISDFLSPLIFFSYVLLIELMSTQLHLGITTTSDRLVIAKVYSVWSFLHLLCRFLLVSVLSSQIPERCQDIVILLQKCPSDKFTHEIERLERLASTPQGLTGLGCFRISKPFILSVIQVIFTCEIIFLQSTTSKI